MFTQLLIAVDGSDCSTRAAKFGLELAKRYDAAVDIVHATTDESAGNEALKAATDFDVSDETDVETHLIQGKPAQVVNNQASEHEADLIVMGRRGRHGVSEKLLGNVAERVLRQSNAPVLTVPDGPIKKSTGTEYSDLLTTTDGSEVAEQAAPYGENLASTLNATLHMLTVVDVKSEAGVFDAGGVKEEYIERLEDEGWEALQSFEGGLDTSGIDVEPALLRGEIIETITEYVNSHDIDLLVMASEGEANLVGQHIGSTTEKVLHNVDQPVLVIPIPE